MPRPTLSEKLDDIEKIVRTRPGITSAQIEDDLREKVPRCGSDGCCVLGCCALVLLYQGLGRLAEPGIAPRC